MKVSEHGAALNSLSNSPLNRHTSSANYSPPGGGGFYQGPRNRCPWLSRGVHMLPRQHAVVDRLQAFFSGDGKNRRLALEFVTVSRTRVSNVALTRCLTSACKRAAG